MDNWILIGPKLIKKKSLGEQSVEAGQVKVRITHVLLTSFDTLCYTGEKKIIYPRTFGRVAIGIITEVGDGCYGVQKGARVYVNAVRSCGKCYNCRSGNRAECTSLDIAVEDFDGFLRDFIVCKYYDVFPLPDSLDDMLALCIENVALAENIFEKLNLETGSRVAIVGGGYFGTILTQVALYHKMVPIVIDNNPSNIERLKRSGAYFAFFADDSLEENIDDATSGSLCDAAIYTSCCKLSPSIPASVLSHDKDMVLGGFSTANFSVSTAPIFEKNLRLYGITNGFGYTETAINMLVHNAIDITNFEKEVLTEFDLKKVMDHRADTFSHTGKMTVLKLA